MITPFLKTPQPDFEAFRCVLTGERIPDRVHLVELSMDQPVMRALVEGYSSEEWFTWDGGFQVTPPEVYYRQLVTLYYWLGYDFAPVWATWPNHPDPKHRVTVDTATDSGENRHWVEEGYGLIRSWDDFHAFPWDAIQPDPRPVEYAARHLPPGMKLTVNTTYFEHLFENLLGLEGLSYLFVDDPALVDAVFERWGEVVLRYYEAVIGHTAVGAIFHADDMGFKTSTLISPRALRRLVLPWHKRFADLAHAHSKLFLLHSCGNLYRQDVITDLIETVGIDGFHSFQDVILPVAEFKQHYGDRVATLGGVDMDKLVRLDEVALRAYIRDILAAGMQGGRFALGSGNTVANYVPLDHYLIMLDEARGWNATA